MTALEDARRALDHAAETHRPACHADDRFTAVSLTLDEQAVLRCICRKCPLMALCATYVDHARPAGGFWAGKLRTPHGARKSSGKVA